MPEPRAIDKATVVQIENPEPRSEVIIFQGNFSILTIDDLALTLKLASPSIKFGLAMNESVPQLTRVTGNSEDLKKLAAKNTLSIGAGHAGVIFIQNAFPVNVLNAVKSHPCVCQVYAASSNPMEVVIGKTALGKAVLGVVDGTASLNIETGPQKKERKDLVKKIGYGPD
ncbi:MAG: adenosine-specific kinase [Candidatus Ranarchaeia archaeon]|jgi:adenosine/AMP kinase